MSSQEASFLILLSHYNTAIEQFLYTLDTSKVIFKGFLLINLNVSFHE